MFSQRMNESFPEFRLKLYVTPEIVTAQFFIVFASGTQGSQMFLRNIFSLNDIHFYPFPDAAC